MGGSGLSFYFTSARVFSCPHEEILVKSAQLNQFKLYMFYVK